MPGMTQCKCGEYNLSHRVCRKCGAYNGKELIKVAQ
jgi:large subunit ribosomal protein L32